MLLVADDLGNGYLELAGECGGGGYRLHREFIDVNENILVSEGSPERSGKPPTPSSLLVSAAVA